MITTLILSFISAVLFLFLFWRRLKDDYVANQIFTTAMYIIFSVLIFAIGFHYFAPAWRFWVCVGVSIAAVLGGTYRFRMRPIEVGEAVIIASMPALFFLFARAFVSTGWALENAYMALTVFLLFVLFHIFDAHYKKFSWYKSGRVGFAGFSVLGIFFLIRALLAVRFMNMLSFSGRTEIYLSGVAAFLSFLSVFHLSRKVN